jgi:nitrite reductase/ring-hydroxylating ferredoxin subunit
MEDFDTALAPSDFDPDRPPAFDTPWGAFALLRVGGRVVAAQSFCPHMLGPLFEGTRSDGGITCPWHGWRYSLETGACLWKPAGALPRAGQERLRFLEVRLGERGTYVLRPAAAAQGD